jgi:hypothetical protein
MTPDSPLPICCTIGASPLMELAMIGTRMQSTHPVPGESAAVGKRIVELTEHLGKVFDAMVLASIRPTVPQVHTSPRW